MNLKKRFLALCLPAVAAMIAGMPSMALAQGRGGMGGGHGGHGAGGGGFHSGGSFHSSGGFHGSPHGGTRNIDILRNSAGGADFHFRGGDHPRNFHGGHFDGGFHHGFGHPRFGHGFHHDHFDGPFFGFSTTLPLGYIADAPTYYYYGDATLYEEPFANAYEMVAPPLGAFTPILPADAVPVTVGNVTYYSSGGVFYLQQPGGFTVVSPPQGVALTALPPGAVPVNINGVNYYSAYGAYYMPTVQNGATVYTVVSR